MWIDSRFSRTGCRGLQIDPLLSDKMVPDCSKLPSAPESFLNQGIRSPWELTRTQISGLLPKPTMGLPDGDHESAFQRVSTGLERERLGITARNVRGHRPLEPETLGEHHEFSTRAVLPPRGPKLVPWGWRWVEKPDSFYKIQVYI